MPCDSIPQRLIGQAKTRPEAPAHYVKDGGAWRMISYRQYAADVRRAGKALITLGLEPGATVCLLGFNRPEWVILDVGSMAVGCAAAGIYSTSSAEEVRHIVHHADSKVILVENKAQLDKVQKAWAELPHLEWAVLMGGAEPSNDPRVLTWEQFLEKGNRTSDQLFDQRLDALEPDGLAALIYTSGTTGPPKGVMLSHSNLTWTTDAGIRLISYTGWDTTLSYLPLSHIAEHVFSVLIPATVGSATYFAESIEKVADNLKEVEPTLFFGVPRIWEKLHAGISAKLATATGAKRVLLTQARHVGAKYSLLQARGERVDRWLEAQHRLFDKLVYSKLKAAVGLRRARTCVSGAAPISEEILGFFASLDIIIREVYGQSEDTGPTSFNSVGRTKLGSVGPCFPGVDVKIAADGEILVKGPNVFLGYYKDPAATAETLVDGWLYTGDLGKFDEEGFLHITGRKKEIIITAGGKNIAPKNIETALKNHELISDAVIIGDKRKYITALITLDPTAVERFAAEHKLTGKPSYDRPELRDAVQRAVDEVNTHLAQVETVKKFSILPRSFTIEDGELTPTLKIKRRIVNQNFAREIEAMYIAPR